MSEGRWEQGSAEGCQQSRVMLNIQHDNPEMNHWPQTKTGRIQYLPTAWARRCPVLSVWGQLYCTGFHVCIHTGAYLRGLFATGGGGGTAGGGQGGGAGLWRTILTRWRHLVQTVLPGRVGLHAAGGRWVLDSWHETENNLSFCFGTEYYFIFFKAVITRCK